jgi:hypothetical protein
MRIFPQGSSSHLWVLIGVLLALALVIQPGTALNPVDLEIGGSGSVPFHVANIKPGDNGTILIDLHNNGPKRCCLHLFIDNITEQDFGTDGARLDDYLKFTISHSRLQGNITFPALIHELPDRYPAEKSLNITQIYPGEMITLAWWWEFPESGLPMNDAQGDSLGFDIVFILEDQEPSQIYHTFGSFTGGIGRTTEIAGNESVVGATLPLPDGTPFTGTNPDGSMEGGKDATANGDQSTSGIGLSAIVAGPDTAFFLPLTLGILLLGCAAVAVRRILRRR